MPLPRHRVPEIMDDPGLDAGRHRAALRGLARLNAVSRVDAGVWDALAPMARRVAASGRAVRLLDVATGAGDMAVRLACRAAREGIELRVEVCDLSCVALGCARERGDRARVGLVLHCLDVLKDPLPPGFDVATCGLFLHHLDPPDVERVLASMSHAADAVVVQDLSRTRAGLALAWGVSRVLTRSPIVHADAVRSVRAAYTLEEMRAMASRAGLSGARVTPIWPQRLLLVWERTP